MSNTLTKIATVKIKASAGSSKTNGIREAKIPTGKTILQSEAIVANKTNKKLERQNRAETIIKPVKVSSDSEKMKS